MIALLLFFPILILFEDWSVGLKILGCLVDFAVFIYTARDFNRWQIQNTRERAEWESKWVCRRDAHTWTPKELTSETD